MLGYHTTPERVFCVLSTINMKALIQAMRPHQWVKNTLVLGPLLASHKLADASLLLNALLGFVAFCAAASAMYLINDLVDVENDRHHPSKRHRPLASGRLSKKVAVAAAGVLSVCGIAVAKYVGWPFLITLAIYVVTALAYSWFLKRQVLLDVFCLACLYSLRLFGGQTATGIQCSEWLLMFSMFIFLSLAILKRFHEALTLRAGNVSALPGRGYISSDLEYLSIFGFLCGVQAVLVLALYANSEQVRLLYHRPTLLLLICPLLLYYIGRIWLLAHRGEMHNDPVVFTLRDPASYSIGLGILAIIWLARPVI